MDYIGQLGSLSLASRLRRLVDILTRDGTRIYRELEIDFEVRWFAVFRLLNENSPLAVTEIAETLHLRHPTVIQAADEMTRHGLVKSQRDDTDGRKRLLALTAKGRRLAARLTPVWEAFGQVGREATTEDGNDLIGAIEKFEAAIERQSMYERIMSRLGNYQKE